MLGYLSFGGDMVGDSGKKIGRYSSHLHLHIYIDIYIYIMKLTGITLSLDSPKNVHRCLFLANGD